MKKIDFHLVHIVNDDDITIGELKENDVVMILNKMTDCHEYSFGLTKFGIGLIWKESLSDF